MRGTRTEVRRSVCDLRTRTLKTGDLRQALEKAGEHLTGEDGGVQLRVTASGPAVRLSDVLENHLLRIGQEAITNAVKHGPARQILLHLDFRTNEVTMTVEDDGSGFEIGAAPGAASGHFGLEGIRERVKRIGGTLSVQSSPGSGTQLTVLTPLEPHLLETYSA